MILSEAPTYPLMSVENTMMTMNTRQSHMNMRIACIISLQTPVWMLEVPVVCPRLDIMADE
jgi:hypothetical protein